MSSHSDSWFKAIQNFHNSNKTGNGIASRRENVSSARIRTFQTLLSRIGPWAELLLITEIENRGSNLSPNQIAVGCVRCAKQCFRIRSAMKILSSMSWNILILMIRKHWSTCHMILDYPDPVHKGVKISKFVNFGIFFRLWLFMEIIILLAQLLKQNIFFQNDLLHC